MGAREQGYFRGGRRIKNRRRLFWIVLRLVAVDVGESERERGLIQTASRRKEASFPRSGRDPLDPRQRLASRERARAHWVLGVSDVETSPEGLHHTFPLPVLILPSRGTKMRRAAKLEPELPVPWQRGSQVCQGKVRDLPTSKKLDLRRLSTSEELVSSRSRLFRLFIACGSHLSRRRCLLAPRSLDASMLSTH